WQREPTVFGVGDDEMTRLRSCSNVGVITLVLVLGLIGAGCSAESSDSDGAVNFYESLDLASPSAAVETFSDAFAQNDFMTVWLVLDITAQRRVEVYFDLLQWKMVIRTDAVPDMGSEIASALSLESLETTDRWYIFDRVMMIADRNDAYLVDLSGNVTPGNESSVGDDAEVVSVVEGIEGEVRFRLTQSPSGRWRVHQVIVPGGDEDIIPWSVSQP
ncbi:MAG: hypothetical protein ACC658_11415, partial [Acidimicrobiia bacterium]